MTSEQKREFITSLCDSMRDEVIKRIPYMPDNWNGHELREYLAHMFKRESALRGVKPYRRRLREYRNDVATRYGL